MHSSFSCHVFTVANCGGSFFCVCLRSMIVSLVVDRGRVPDEYLTLPTLQHLTHSKLRTGTGDVVGDTTNFLAKLAKRLVGYAGASTYS
jgi:hypothetical protein